MASNSYSRYGRVPSSSAKPHVDVLDIDDEEEENDGMGANMPLNTGDGSSASTGARSSTNSRQNMLEHQREVQKNKMRNRMAGGVVKPHSSLDAKGRNAYGSAGRGYSAPTFSLPQQRPAAQSPSRNVASNSSERVSENKVEGAEAGASSEKPSVKEALRQRKERREHKVEESPRRETEKGRSFHMHDPPPAASPKPQRLPEKGSKGSEDQPIQPNNDRSDSEQSVVPDYPFDFSDMRSFLTQPLPIDAGVVQCYIERKKSGFKWMYPEYYLYMKQDDRFLLAAKKRAKQKTSNYLISMDKGDMNRDSSNFLGKVRSNLMGTEFTVYDDGVKPEKASGPEELREELGVVTYASHVFSSKGPRKMKAAVPTVDPGTNERVAFRPRDGEESMAELFKDGHIQDMVIMVNKPPKWNEFVGAYVLNFNGRVTMASVKNFQLVTPEDHDRVILQFGRTAKDTFTMDARWPLSPLQAFGICVSSFDYKIACD